MRIEVLYADLKIEEIDAQCGGFPFDASFHKPKSARTRAETKAKVII